MAGLSMAPTGRGCRVTWYDCDRKKRSVWLPGCSKRQGETVRAHVEQMQAAAVAGVALDPETVRWLARVTPPLKAKLRRGGLLNAGDVVRLADFVGHYIDSRQDVKPKTLANFRNTEANLLVHFGADRDLATITRGDAEQWRAWLTTRAAGGPGLADNTVRRRTGIARQFFNHAIRRRLLTENPFDGLTAAVHANEQRQHFVPAEIVETALRHCDCPELRAVIALSRYAGLRIPSEIVPLRWRDADLTRRELTIHAPKTEHHPDGGKRVCPIFPELRTHLATLHASAAAAGHNSPDAPVITRWRSPTQSPREPFLRVLRNAGIEPWPKLWHNMRASRETELLLQGNFKVPDLCEWFGHSQIIAMRHYVTSTSKAFGTAVGSMVDDTADGSTAA